MNAKQILAGGALCALSFALVACSGNTNDTQKTAAPAPAPASKAIGAVSPTKLIKPTDGSTNYGAVYEYIPENAPDHVCVIVDKNDYRNGAAISCFLKTDAAAPKQP